MLHTGRTSRDLTVLVLKDRKDVFLLTNIHQPPAERNFKDKLNQPVS
jgi:hypothetical protein